MTPSPRSARPRPSSRGAASTVSGARTALSHGTSALPAGTSGMLPSGNHLSGNQVAPVTGLLGGLPAGSSVLGG